MRWITSNLRTLLLALVLGVSVWISAVTAADPDEVRSPIMVPLEIIGQDPSLVITSETPSIIEVTIRAPSSVWEQFTAQENPVRAILDLSGLGAGDHTENVQIQISVRPTQLVLANPTTVPVNPESIHVTIPISQQGGFRDVAVKVVVSGQVAAGYRLENISVFPQVITVFASDPELVNNLPGVVETQTLDLQEAKEDITTRLALTLPQNITIVGVQTVEVQVGISPIQTSLTLLNQTINVTGLPEGLTAVISPQTVDVIISGPLPGLD